MSPASDALLVAELDRIADRIATLADSVASLRADNLRLREALDASAAENRTLRERVVAARERVERLLDALPEHAS